MLGLTLSQFFDEKAATVGAIVSAHRICRKHSKILAISSQYLSQLVIARTSVKQPPTTAILCQRSLAAFEASDSATKAAAARALFDPNGDNASTLDRPTWPGAPGRPARPTLVSPRELTHRSLATESGRAALIHAIAHIEFNAMNLALDAVGRFADVPDEFVHDWATVACEEALHFSLLRDHLETLGYAYGDFPAHNGLWEMAEKTKHDLLARLALVPRTLEARGLDVSPAMREKLAQAGDHKAAEILDVILRDEIGHVAIGNKWFRHYCAIRKLDPLVVYETLSREFDAPVPRPPFNVSARLSAGFAVEEIDWLVTQSKRNR